MKVYWFVWVNTLRTETNTASVGVWTSVLWHVNPSQYALYQSNQRVNPLAKAGENAICNIWRHMHKIWYIKWLCGCFNFFAVILTFVYVFLSLIQQVFGYPQPCWQRERGVQNHTFKWAHQLIYHPVMLGCGFLNHIALHCPFLSIVSMQA